MSAPPPSVLEAFGLEAEPSPLPGGEGRSWLVGDVVLKPCDDSIEWTWLAMLTATIEQDDFRLMHPLVAADGGWVVQGWCAQERLSGKHPEHGRWLEMLAVGERLHARLRSVPRPEFLDARTNPWAVGDRVAWGEAPPPTGFDLLDTLLSLLRPIHIPSQVIHGDLTENVLFADGLPPAVIDVTPYFRPSGFASAIVVADATVWRHARPEPLFAALAHVEHLPQLLVRAVIYRMVTTILLAASERERRADVDVYRPIVELCIQLGV
jgi:uncharacterized protein (TIGR02569 family)